MIKKYRCLHCSNQLVNHKFDKFKELINKLVDYILFLVPFRKKSIVIENIFFYYFNNLFVYLKILEIKDDFVREKIFNRTLILIDEAEKHGLKIRPLVVRFNDKYFNNFHFRLNDKNYYFEGLPTNFNDKQIDFELIDDKYKLKKFLEINNMPTAPGGTFITKNGGYEYGLKLGFPLVVKPKDSSLSNHVTIRIENEEGLKRAIAVVKKLTNFYVVEKFISGDVHRISVIDQKIFAVKRLPASIIGDGKKNIKELLEIKNKHPYRGEFGQRNTTLHKIEIDDITLRLLKNQGLSLDSILEPGQVAILKEKVNLGSGSDIIEMTEEIHPANKLIALKLAELLNTDILGIDFICSNINKSWQEQDCAIIECNSLPYIDMHHYPVLGQSQNVARAIIELILKK